MITTTITMDSVVGYIYNADIYCAECAVNAVRKDLLNRGAAVPALGISVDDSLDALAVALGVDRDDALDSDEFPAPMFADMTSITEVCGGCTEFLVEESLEARVPAWVLHVLEGDDEVELYNAWTGVDRFGPLSEDDDFGPWALSSYSTGTPRWSVIQDEDGDSNDYIEVLELEHQGVQAWVVHSTTNTCSVVTAYSTRQSAVGAYEWEVLMAHREAGYSWLFTASDVPDVPTRDAMLAAVREAAAPLGEFSDLVSCTVRPDDQHRDGATISLWMDCGPWGVLTGMLDEHWRIDPEDVHVAVERLKAYRLEHAVTA